MSDRSERMRMLASLGGVLDRQIANAVVQGRDLEEIAETLGQYNVAYDQCTCSECPDVATCDMAWDPYNTQGSCLAGK